MMSPENNLSDEFLLQALSDGAILALEALYQRYSRPCYSLAYRIIGDHSIAEELVQDAFVAVWQHAASYCPQSGSVHGWLFSIVHHQAIDALRSLRRRSNMKQLPWDEIEQEDMLLADTCEQVIRSELCSLVREAVGKLPREQSMVIALAFFQGWTHTEIAQKLQLPLGTVKSRIHLGLLRLKQTLEQSSINEMLPSDSHYKVKTSPRQAVATVVQVMEAIV